MELLSEIKKKYSLDKEEIDAFQKLFFNISLSKNDYFLREGYTCDKLAFIESGYLRSFYITEDGNEVTTNFYSPGQIVLEINSFTFQTISKEYIQSITPAYLKAIYFKDMRYLEEKFPVWKKIAKNVLELKMIASQKRIDLLQNYSAKDRYVFFLENFPLLLQNVPLKYIASFLGIDLATLSRIRNKI